MQLATDPVKVHLHYTFWKSLNFVQVMLHVCMQTIRMSDEVVHVDEIEKIMLSFTVCIL